MTCSQFKAQLRTTRLPGAARVTVWLAAAVFSLAPATPHAGQPRESANSTGADAQFKRALEKIRLNQLPAALQEVDGLIATYPNFRLAHLIRGDLLLARAKPLATFGNTGHAASERVDELRAEALTRLRAYNEHPPSDRVPRYLLQLDPAQKRAVVVDAKRSRVYLYENANGMPRLVGDYYTTLGKRGLDKLARDDKKTPLGVYEVTRKIPGSQLPDLYGWGALPISYPNEWDKKLGKTGNGIWLHGVPSDTYARAPWASDGCIALANPDIEQISNQVQPGVTPVIIAGEVEWVTPAAWRTERDAFMRTLEAWRTDWESRDTERYLKNYARDFRSNDMNLASWRAQKQRVSSNKTFIKVALSKVSAFRSPGKQDLVAVTFDQEYRSDGITHQNRKRQYWINEDGRWKIAYEGNVSESALVMPESFREGQPRQTRAQTRAQTQTRAAAPRPQKAGRRS